MRIAHVSAIALTLLAASTASQAAVSVLGNGQAHTCYIQAEYNIEPKDSVAICTDALKNDVLSQVDRASTLINRAILRARSMDMDGAMADYDAAIAVGSNADEVYLNRSATFIAMKRYADALKDADQAVAMHTPRIEIAYFNRALANEALGNIQAAYADFQAALQAEPRFTAAAEQLSRFHVTRSGT